jgi:hypothetical protein
MPDESSGSDIFAPPAEVEEPGPAADLTIILAPDTMTSSKQPGSLLWVFPAMRSWRATSYSRDSRAGLSRRTGSQDP